MPATTIQPERQRCRHIHADGRRCGSPRLRGEAFCYFHHTSRKPIARPEARRSRRSAFDLPLPEDRTSIQLSIGEILRRIALNDVDPRRAGLLLYGLQIASTNLAQARNQATPAPLEAPIEELTLDPAHGPLAHPAPFVPTSAVAGKPSLVDLLLERLRSPAEPEGDRQDSGSDDLPPALPLEGDPCPAPSYKPIVLPEIQAATAPSPRPQRASYPHSTLMPILRLTFAALLSTTTLAQQVIERGALGTPPSPRRHQHLDHYDRRVPSR